MLTVKTLAPSSTVSASRFSRGRMSFSSRPMAEEEGRMSRTKFNIEAGGRVGQGQVILDRTTTDSHNQQSDQ